MEVRSEILTGDKHPALHERAQALVREAFAPFMDHSEIVNRLWKELYLRWSRHQFVLINEVGDPIVLGNAFPLHCDDNIDSLPDGGVEWALEEAVRQSDERIRPNVACAFQIIISRQARGLGLSYRSVNVMKQVNYRLGLTRLIAPVRPNRKEKYPTMPIEEYAAWDRDDSLPVDDWMRVHVKLGGEMLNICNRSFVVEGSLDEWAEWTGRKFERDGPHPVEGGLVPVEVSLSENCARYIEPNVWFIHHMP